MGFARFFGKFDFDFADALEFRQRHMTRATTTGLITAMGKALRP